MEENILNSDYRPTQYGSTDYDQIMDDTNLDRCIRDCLACYQECMSCLPHCIGLGGKHGEQKHLNSMIECIEVCNVSFRLMQLKGQYAYEQCQVCAKVCEACEASCRSVDPDDSMMMKCAEMCRKCADSCREMTPNVA